MGSLRSTIVEFDMTSLTGKEVELEKFHAKNGKIYWIHCDLTQESDLAILVAKLNLPGYLIELCTQENDSKRVIDREFDLTIQLSCALHEEPDEKYEFSEGNLLIYLTKDYCFTASFSQQPALLKFKESYSKNIKFASTTCFIYFLILDSVINDYSTVLEAYELIADNIDLQMREMHTGAYGEVMQIKKQVAKVKRYVALLRDILMRISGRKLAVISEQCRLSLCGLFDHTQMIVNEADAVRDILNSTLDLIDNSLMQKMNATMKILTAFSAIFLPMAVITGIYGMNFRWIPELGWKYGYFFALSLMALCGVSLLILFKKRKWF